MKRCPMCDKEFPADRENFYSEPRNKSGLAARCKQCYRKKYNRRPVKDGYKVCNKCKEEKEMRLFSIDNHTKSGYKGCCKSCSNEAQNKRSAEKYRDLTGKHSKVCKECGQEKLCTLDNFYQNKNCKYGVYNTCKDCERKKSTRYEENLNSERECKQCGIKKTKNC